MPVVVDMSVNNASAAPSLLNKSQPMCILKWTFHAAQSGGANSLCGVAVDARDGEGLAMTLDQVEVDPSRGRRP